MIIKNGNILSFEENAFVKKDIEVIDGKIVRIADSIVNESNEVFDASGSYITPGLIDAHTHICISEEGKGAIADDCNDYSEPVMPYLEPIDAIYPFDEAVPRAIRGGVTSACVCPGSDSVIGGVCTTIQLKGNVAEEMIINRKTAIKCSFGENPKTAGYGFKTRMGLAYTLRKALEDAKDYQYRKNLALKNKEYFKKDIGMENMLLLLNKEIPMHAHVHRSDDIYTAIRICKEYDLDLVLIHATDGSTIKEEIAKSGHPVVLGPSMMPKTKLESGGRSFKTPKDLSDLGVKVCITSDHDVTPIYYLVVYAGMCVQQGLDEIEALKAITINPAQVLNIDDTKGDLKVGKDADIVIWKNHPFDISTSVEQVFIQGVKQIN